MPANGRWDLIRRLKVKAPRFSAHQLHVALQEKQLSVNDGYKSE